MLTVEYCGKFGSIVETENAIYIFDYTVGRLPSRYLLSNKPKTFFLSRNDLDHYSESIVSFDLPVIAAYDFESNRLKNTMLVSPGDSVHLGYARIYALPCTRRGVSYIIKERNHQFFFGGDFNLWHWPNMFSDVQVHDEFVRYYSVLKEITNHGYFDLAMMTVDPIMHVDYDRGARELIHKIRPHFFMPLNFDSNRKIESFYLWSKALEDTTVITPVHQNEVVTLK